MNIILEDNFDKVTKILDMYRQSWQTVLWFQNEHIAIDIIGRLPKPVKLTLFIDGELRPGCGSGLAFLNRMIDDWPTLIERVIVCSYSDATRKEMIEICAENLIAVELLSLPFAK